MGQPYVLALQRSAVRGCSSGGSKFRSLMCQSLGQSSIREVTREQMGLCRLVHTSAGQCSNRGGSLLWRWLPGQMRDAVLKRTRRRDGATAADELVYSSTVGGYAFWSQIVVYCTCAPVALVLVLDAYRSYSDRGQAEAAALPPSPRSGSGGSALAYLSVEDAGPLKPLAVLVVLALVAVVRTVTRRTVWRIYYDAKRDSFTAILPGLLANRRVAFLPGEVRSFPDDVFGNHTINGSRYIIAPQNFKDNIHYNHMVE